MIRKKTIISSTLEAILKGVGENIKLAIPAHEMNLMKRVFRLAETD